MCAIIAGVIFSGGKKISSGSRIQFSNLWPVTRKRESSTIEKPGCDGSDGGGSGVELLHASVSVLVRLHIAHFFGTLKFVRRLRCYVSHEAPIERIFVLL